MIIDSRSEAFFSTHNPAHNMRCLVRLPRSLALPAALYVVVKHNHATLIRARSVVQVHPGPPFSNTVAQYSQRSEFRAGNSRSFIAKSDDRVDAHSAARGNETRGESDRDEKHDDGQKDERVRGAYAIDQC